MVDDPNEIESRASILGVLIWGLYFAAVLPFALLLLILIGMVAGAVKCGGVLIDLVRHVSWTFHRTTGAIEKPTRGAKPFGR